MRLWVSPRFHLVVFVFGVIKRISRHVEYKIPNINDGKFIRRFSRSYRELLDRVAFRILSSINDGAPLPKYEERLCDWANGGYVDDLLHL